VVPKLDTAVVHAYPAHTEVALPGTA
jgi:hypothetical protein